MDTNNIQNEFEEEIDLGELLRVLLKKLPILLAVTILGAALAFAYTRYLVTPLYKTTFTAFINNYSEGTSTEIRTSNDTNAAKSLSYTYAAIMKNRDVVTDAIELAGLNCTYDDVNKHIGTKVETDTQLVSLSVEMASPEDALNLANAIATVAPDYIANIVEGSSMKIAENAILATKPSSPSYKRNLALGALIGFALAAMVVIILHLTDRSIKSETELEKAFGIPIIGSIPDFSDADRNARYGYGYGKPGKKGDR